MFQNQRQNVGEFYMIGNAVGMEAVEKSDATVGKIENRQR